MQTFLKFIAPAILPILILSLFIKTVVWSALIQPFEFPDEQAHIAAVNFFAQKKRMPQGKELDLSNEIKSTEAYLGTLRDKNGNNKYTYHPEFRLEYTSSQTGKYENQIKKLNNAQNKNTFTEQEAARYPFLYYFYSAIFYGIAQNSDIFTRLFVVRLANTLVFLGTTLIAYLIGLEIFRKKSHAVLLASLVGLQPMFTFLGAGVNSDNLHIFLFSAITLLCLRLISNGWSRYLSFFIGLSMSLDLMTKPQAYIAILVIAFAILLRFAKDKNIKQYITEIIKIILVILILAGWYELPIIFEKGVIGFKSTSNLSNLDLINFAKFSFNKFYSQNIVWYWGVFKWLGVVLPKPYWWISNRLVALSILGLIVYFIKALMNKKNIFVRPQVLIFLLFVTIIYVLSIYWYDWQFTKNFGYSFGVQARYYFPTIIAQMAILQIGILGLIPKKYEFVTKISSLALIIWFAILNVAGLITVLSSYYDITRVKDFINEISQYKPFFVKGEWGIFWLFLYFISITTVVFSNIYLIFKKNDI